MKLSRAQAEVLSKMKAGITLYRVVDTGQVWLKCSPAGLPVPFGTFTALLDRGLITPRKRYRYPILKYRLTDKGGKF